MVRVMILEPGKHAEVRFICPKKLDIMLGGAPEIEEVFDGIAIAVNAEGKIKGLPLNRSVLDDKGEIADIFAGTMVIFGYESHDTLISLSDEQIIQLLGVFGEPETPGDWV